MCLTPPEARSLTTEGFSILAIKPPALTEKEQFVFFETPDVYRRSQDSREIQYTSRGLEKAIRSY